MGSKGLSNNTIDSNSHTEGKYTQQTKKIKTKYNPTNRRKSLLSKRTTEGSLTIPWDKKTANEILTGEKIFGEDSINITNFSEVQYIVKFPSGNPSRTSFEMQTF